MKTGDYITLWKIWYTNKGRNGCFLKRKATHHSTRIKNYSNVDSLIVHALCMFFYQMRFKQNTTWNNVWFLCLNVNACSSKEQTDGNTELVRKIPAADFFSDANWPWPHFLLFLGFGMEFKIISRCKNYFLWKRETFISFCKLKR